jgi:lipopolysaccharide transport system ATP-binding protein
VTADNDYSVLAEGLGKKFGTTIRQTMQYGFYDTLRRIGGLTVDPRVLRKGEFWAVQDVGFALKPGDALGIMGVNGSGKTTLLRILNGTYRPDTGRVAMKGRIGALIAAGAGFSPTLTGRENVFINASLIGLKPSEIRAKFDEIVDFSGLGEFIDMPIRHYSSGMSVRLGFAIAAFAEPDVLLVDEALAVGDMAFQKKCFDHVLSLKKNGTTILLVSHSIGAIWSVCDRGLFLDGGKAILMGHVEDVIKAYDDRNAKNTADEKSHTLAGGTGDAFVRKVEVFGLDGLTRRDTFSMEEGFLIRARVEVKNTIPKPILRYTIDAAHYKFICVLDSYEQGWRIDELRPGVYTWDVRVPSQNMRPGAYKLNVAISAREAGIAIYFAYTASSFIIRNDASNLMFADPNSIFHLPAGFSVNPETAARAGGMAP